MIYECIFLSCHSVSHENAFLPGTGRQHIRYRRRLSQPVSKVHWLLDATVKTSVSLRQVTGYLKPICDGTAMSLTRIMGPSGRRPSISMSSRNGLEDGRSSVGLTPLMGLQLDLLEMAGLHPDPALDREPFLENAPFGRRPLRVPQMLGDRLQTQGRRLTHGLRTSATLTWKTNKGECHCCRSSALNPFRQCVFSSVLAHGIVIDKHVSE